jgi:tetratricopeptide (TPR) repeat protein
MSSNMGYVYVLANSAMPGLVKIGKTTRGTSERAAELSAATGLPTPFIVVYEQLFDDCSAAESFVHTYLEHKGGRVSDNREFFNAPVNEVVRAISLAPGAIESNTSVKDNIEDELVRSSEEYDELDSLSLSSSQQLSPWHSVFEEAKLHYYGLDDYIQDYTEALRLFRQAATLGSNGAYAWIAKMYSDGEGVRKDLQKALQVLKEGARKGSLLCYWRMGCLFLMPDGNIENAEKAFSLFTKNLPSLNLDLCENIPADDVDCILREMGLCMMSVVVGRKLPTSVHKLIYANRHRVKETNLRLTELLKEDGDAELSEIYLKISELLANMEPS